MKTRIWEDTHRLLRRIAARQDTTMIEVIDRLVREEADRLAITLPNAQPAGQAANGTVPEDE